MTGDLVELSLCHKGGLGEKVASLLLGVLNPSLKELDGSCTLGKKDGQTLTDGFYGGEELELTSDLVMVALECLLLLLNIRVELVLGGEGYTVYSLKHLVVLVALVVCAGALSELECLDSAGGVKMRACAEVYILALLIEGENCVITEVVDSLYLVGLVELGHELECFSLGKGELLYEKIFLDDLLHLSFDILEDFGSEGNLGIEVLEVACIGSRADGLLGVGIKSLYRLSHDVSCGVTEYLRAVGIAVGEELNARFVLYYM